MVEDFKPNIYPIIYWGLMYGLTAGFLLFIMFMLSRYLTMVWFPVFLAGVVWGGYRNYKKQKRESGQGGEPKAAIEEFKEAARDILGATREMVSERLEEAVVRDATKQEAVADTEEELVEVAGDTILEEEADTVPEVVSDEQIPTQSEEVEPVVEQEEAPTTQSETQATPEVLEQETKPETLPTDTSQKSQSPGENDTQRSGPPAPPVSQKKAL